MAAMSRMSSPCSVAPPSIIFRPLYSGGLWLPVTATPVPLPVSTVAKYTSGVGTMPMSITSTPAAHRPADSARASAGPDSRPSRPTTTWPMPRARALAPSARPMAETASSVSAVSTMPRMS